MRKFVPHYGHGDHALYSDIIAMTSPYWSFYQQAKSESILLGFEASRYNLDLNAQHYNQRQLQSFLAGCQVKWELSAKVAAMFTSPNAHIIMPGRTIN